MTVSSRLGGTVDWMTWSWVANSSGGDAGEEPVDGEDASTIDALDADAGDARRLGIAADRVDRPAEGRVAHPERRERRSGRP